MEQGIRSDIFRCPRISQQESKLRHGTSHPFPLYLQGSSGDADIENRLMDNGSGEKERVR